MKPEKEIRDRLIHAYRIFWLYRVLNTGIDRQRPMDLPEETQQWAELRARIVKTANLIKAQYADEFPFEQYRDERAPISELEFGRVIGEWQTLSEVLAPDEGNIREVAGIVPGEPLPELPNVLTYGNFPLSVPKEELV